MHPILIQQDGVTYRMGGAGLGRYYFAVDSVSGWVSVAEFLTGTEQEYQVSHSVIVDHYC